MRKRRRFDFRINQFIYPVEYVCLFFFFFFDSSPVVVFNEWNERSMHAHAHSFARHAPPGSCARPPPPTPTHSHSSFQLQAPFPLRPATRPYVAKSINKVATPSPAGSIIMAPTGSVALICSLLVLQGGMATGEVRLLPSRRRGRLVYYFYYITSSSRCFHSKPQHY